ncbi:hypothetical protein OPV22_005028 [Ensete ventricosum]|uniref:Secreted protein n=1 Tax=Ensete ventricosum TaxID=4639 RepID=A0AAV8Q7Z9_ENSVE|nr:hypothetical protein OPV22_005028 [Ensete ventricosum]
MPFTPALPQSALIWLHLLVRFGYHNMRCTFILSFGDLWINQWKHSPNATCIRHLTSDFSKWCMTSPLPTFLLS